MSKNVKVVFKSLDDIIASAGSNLRIRTSDVGKITNIEWDGLAGACVCESMIEIILAGGEVELDRTDVPTCDFYAFGWKWDLALVEKFIPVSKELIVTMKFKRVEDGGCSDCFFDDCDCPDSCCGSGYFVKIEESREEVEI